MFTRQDKLLHCINPSHQVGIEIGPLDRPVVTREMGRVFYVDHATTEELQQKYKIDSNVDIDKIVDIDYVWGKQDLVATIQGEGLVDYILASHVIEHVPNLIGWLNEMSQMLKVGGILTLAIPDKRRCFDFCRNTTGVPEVVEAFLENYQRPSPRQVFEHFNSAVLYKGNHAWGEAPTSTDISRLYNISQAWHVTQKNFESDNYCDVHCWVFTPLSFFQLLSELAKIDLLKFDLVKFYPTEGCEFFVSLKSVETVNLESINSLIAELEVNVDDSEKDDVVTEPTVEHDTTNEFLMETIKAMESSKFWKMRTVWFKVKKKLGLFVQ
jgi:hypothetical protein